MSRIDEDISSLLKEFGRKHWGQLLKEAETLFTQPSPSPFSKTYLKDLTFQQTAKARMLATLYTLARVMSGAVHPSTENKRDEKDAMEIALAEARLCLGIDPRDGKKRGEIDVIGD